MKTINNILKSICVCSIVASMASCDILDTKPYDFVAPETFYSNESDCTMALAGIYSTISKEDVYGSRYSCMISNIDDLSYYARRNQSNNVISNSHNTSQGDIFNCWTSLYGGINNANVLLDNIGKAKFSDETVRTRIKGEAKFLRAYYHFLLVQTWYEVPIRKETVTDIALSAREATPHADALDWIINEMEECLDMVDDSNYDLSPSHVKKTVVEGILARVCLWRAGSPSNGGKPFYQKAAKYAKAVYDSQKHHLNPDAYTMWKNMASDRYDVSYNESMWEAEFIGTRDNGEYTESKLGATLGNLQENTKLDGTGYSYGFYAGTLILWDLYNEPTDVRRDLSMAPYKINSADKQVAWKATEIVTRRCGKFRREWETSTPKNKNYTQENFPILRYADVLLMLAEAENEVNQGPTPLAYAALKEVRKRALVSEIQGLSYANFQEVIRDERARELCFEATRKYDLVRWGIYNETIKNKLGAATQSPRWAKDGNSLGCAQFVDNTTEKHQFMPIPEKELGVNVKLQQNKYWQ